eukprot:91650-Pleurochrysis_carterae.AAC.1
MTLWEAPHGAGRYGCACTRCSRPTPQSRPRNVLCAQRQPVTQPRPRAHYCAQLAVRQNATLRKFRLELTCTVKSFIWSLLLRGRTSSSN